MKKEHVAWMGLVATIFCSVLLVTLLLEVHDRRLGRALENTALLGFLISYGLLLLGLKNRGPLLTSFVTLIFVGWLGANGSSFRGAGLVRLVPNWVSPKLLYSLSHQPDGVLLLFMLKVIVVPLLAFESLRRESPTSRSATYFRRAQITEVLAIMLGYCSAWSGDPWIGHSIWLVSLALMFCTLGYVIVGSLLLLSQVSHRLKKRPEQSLESGADELMG